MAFDHRRRILPNSPGGWTFGERVQPIATHRSQAVFQSQVNFSTLADSVLRFGVGVNDAARMPIVSLQVEGTQSLAVSVFQWKAPGDSASSRTLERL